MNVLITGASGGLGSHLVEAFSARGDRVTGLVRSVSSAEHLRAVGARFIAADLGTGRELPDGQFRQQCIVHAAARVGDECSHAGQVAVEQRATAAVLEAAVRAGCRRFIHISSIAVHDLPDDGGNVRETTRLNERPDRWNHYVRAKIACERLVSEEQRAGRIEVTIIRPSVFLGRYDRHTTPRILRFLRSPLAGAVGEGDNLVPCVDLAELAQLVVAAAESPRAAGQTYDVSGTISITQADLLALHAAAAGLPPPRRRPRPLARAIAAVIEGVGRITAPDSPPLVSRFLFAVADLNCRVDSTRAASDLGWRGQADLTRSIHEAVSWSVEHAA